MESGNKEKPIRTLFTAQDGSSLNFYLRPSKLRLKLRPTIEDWGGTVTNKPFDPTVFHIVEPDVQISSTSENYIKVQYIYDCIEKKFLLPVDKYRIYKSEQLDPDSDLSFTESVDGYYVNTTEKHTRARREYTQKDDMKIMQYIILYHAIRDWKGKKIWEEMEKTFGDRSWQSLKERFRKQIKPHFDTYPLSPTDHKYLKKGCDMWTKKDEKRFQKKINKINTQTNTQNVRHQSLRDNEATSYNPNQDASEETSTQNSTNRPQKAINHSRLDRKSSYSDSDPIETVRNIETVSVREPQQPKKNSEAKTSSNVQSKWLRIIHIHTSDESNEQDFTLIPRKTRKCNKQASINVSPKDSQAVSNINSEENQENSKAGFSGYQLNGVKTNVTSEYIVGIRNDCFPDTEVNENIDKPSNLSEDQTFHLQLSSSKNSSACSPNIETEQILTSFSQFLSEQTTQSVNKVDVNKMRTCLSNKLAPKSLENFEVLSDTEPELSDPKCVIDEFPSRAAIDNSVNSLTSIGGSEEGLQKTMKKKMTEILNNSQNTSIDTQVYETCTTGSSNNGAYDSLDEDILNNYTGSQALMYNLFRKNFRGKLSPSKEQTEVDEPLLQLMDIRSTSSSQQSQETSGLSENMQLRSLPTSSGLFEQRNISPELNCSARKRLHLNESEHSTPDKVRSYANQENHPLIEQNGKNCNFEVDPRDVSKNLAQVSQEIKIKIQESQKFCKRKAVVLKDNETIVTKSELETWCKLIDAAYRANATNIRNKSFSLVANQDGLR